MKQSNRHLTTCGPDDGPRLSQPGQQRSGLPSGWLLLLMTALLLSGFGLFTQSASAMDSASDAAPQATDQTFNTRLLSRGEAYVLQSQPTTNYGSGPVGVIPNSEGYVIFDLSGLPSDAVIDFAGLRMKVADPVGTGSSRNGVGRVDAAWDETTVTYNTRPATTFGSPPPTANTAPGVDWAEWEVTPLVRRWHDGTDPNYGFALRTVDAGVYFHSKETGYAPELLVRYTVPQDDQPRPDLGDVPDSSNHHGVANVAYPVISVNGRFPTVHEDPTGAPSGPKHANATRAAILGDHISAEVEADQGADADGPNNILRDASGTIDGTFVNRDRADDGWLNRTVPFPNCRRTTLYVRVSKAAATSVETMYLNVFFDGNRDGDWEDVGVCQDDETGQQARSYEWIVQDRVIDLTSIPGGFVDIPVTTNLIHNDSPTEAHWMRFTLSESRAVRNPTTSLADGRGPAAPEIFAHGETEDVVQRPSPQGEPGTLTLTKAVLGADAPVAYGGTVTYTINLKYDGGSRPVQTEIRDLLSYPQHLVGPIQVTEVMTGVSPLLARADYQRDALRWLDTNIRWRGTLEPNAEVQISFPVHIHPFCAVGEETKEIVNQATALNAAGQRITDTVNFQALCPGVSLDDISVSQDLAEEDVVPDVSSRLGNFEIQDFRQMPVRTRFTNNGGSALTMGFMVEIEGIDAGSRSGTADRSGDAAQAHHVVRRSGVLNLDAGESDSIITLADVSDLLGDLLEQFPTEAGDALAIRSRVSYALLPEDLANINLSAMDPSLIKVVETVFSVRPWDLGDAPDSTNHAGAAMTTYASGVTATFPTVFDPATGTPEGPAHARPRPFHLGRGVEMERDADLLPLPRNITPSANVANQDRGDDGLRLSSINFEHCKTSTMQAQIFASPAAIAFFQQAQLDKAHVNVWVDGNRDGDWADNVACGDTGTALEHIVIDQAVSIASLTPGLNNITLNTGLVPWPAAQSTDASWLRITLSERPSNKTLTTAGVSHGDGRGYSTPFRTGETEDYLLHQQPEYSVQMEGRAYPVMENQATPPGFMVDDNHGQAWRQVYAIRLRNNGKIVPENLTVELSIPDNFSVTDIQGTAGLYTGCLTCTRTLDATAGTVRLPLNLRRIASLGGDPNAINLFVTVQGYVGCLTCTRTIETNAIETRAIDMPSLNTDTLVRASIVEQDADNGNNSAEVLLRNRLAPTIGWQVEEGESARTHCDPVCPPLTATLKLNRIGTTFANNIVSRGQAAPNSTVIAMLQPQSYSHSARSHGFSGWLTATVVAGDNGQWSHTWRGLNGGNYRLRAAYGANSRLYDASTPYLYEAVLKVAPELPVDPSTFRIVDSQNHPVSSSWVAYETWPSKWKVEEGESYQVAVRGKPGLEEVTLALDYLVITLENVVGTNFYIGEFTVPAALGRSGSQSLGKLSLTVVDGGVEQVFQSEVESAASGLVQDAVGNAALADATVTLLNQIQVESTSAQAVFVSWDGAAEGQVNPQTTVADGRFSFGPEAGTYRLLVEKDGYQPFRTDDLTQEEISQTVGLSPAVSATPALQIFITEEGFSPSVADVVPGGVVEVVNHSLSEHWVEAQADARQGAASPVDSGVLVSGERYRFVVGTSGTLTLNDRLVAGNGATLTVASGQIQIFLPNIQR